MSGKKSKKKAAKGVNSIASNRYATHEYLIEERFEAGLVLHGWEVKSIRDGRVQMSDTYVMIRDNEIWWVGGQITPLLSASTHINPAPSRSRKLLLNRKEIDKLIGAVERKGYTLVPLAMYWSKGRAKMEIGLAKGKKEHDKRADSKEHDWNREKARILKSTLNQEKI